MLSTSWHTADLSRRPRRRTRLSSRGLYRGIFSALIDDEGYQRLSPVAKLTFLTMRLSAQNTPASMLRLYPALLAAQTGYDTHAVEEALRELERGAWIEREGVLVWLRNGLRYDPSISLADPKHRRAIERAISAFPRCALVAKFCAYYRIPWPFDEPWQALARPFDGGSPPSSTPTPTPTPNPTPTPSPPYPPNTVDMVDNPPGLRLDPGSTRSAVALDSDNGIEPTAEQRPRDAIADRRAFLLAQAKALLETETGTT